MVNEMFMTVQNSCVLVEVLHNYPIPQALTLILSLNLSLIAITLKL